MASFVIFSNFDENKIDSYKTFIQRLQQETKLQVKDIAHFPRASNYQYYCANKNKSKLHGIKDFIYKLSMKMCDGGFCIMICDNPMPTLVSFIRHIQQVKEPDGINPTAYYYGEIKSIITAFMNYITSVIDETAKKINKHTFFLDNKLFIELIDETAAIYEENHALFLKHYLPLNSDIEKEDYQQVTNAHANFLEELKNIRAIWEIRQDKLEIFAKKAFDESIQKISDLCKFTHAYIAVMLADRLYEIAVSIEESVNRMKSNLEKCKDDHAHEKNMLIQNLYERNKEHLNIYRRLNNRSIDTAEVKRTMDSVREKIENIGNNETLARLELESRFWNKRLIDFNEIASILIKIQIELENLEKEREKYKTMTCLELPGSKSVPFDLIGKNIEERISYLKKKQLEMSRALITYFCVRGTDRVLYTDRVGSFYVDEFNHQNYISHYGLKYFHVNCYGEFVEYSENTPYYFDDNGRYTLDENGEKIYQVAACTSQYKLTDGVLLKKITKDCGHSEKPNPNCRLEEIKDLTDKVILPRNDNPVDITGTLDHESVKYLWEHFGMFLPEVLYDVFTKNPKNPIHAMAHSLLKRKFKASAADLRNMRKDAEKYRHDIKKKLKDKAIMERNAWKATLMKRRKPDHYDTSYEQGAYQQIMDRQVDTMAYYY